MPLKEKTYIRDGFVSAGNAEVTGSLGVSGTITGNLTGNVTGNVTGNASTATTATSASFASTASFLNTLNQNILITGSLTVGATSLGANENTLVLGPAPAGGTGEGGQLLLQASGGLYTSASMWDNWQNYTRLLRGTNAASDAVVAQFNMHSKQVSFPQYNSTSAFSGTLVGLLGFDSSGNILTTTTGSGGGGGSVTINNNTDNYIITATGTANTIQGEPKLQFDGSTLSVTGSMTATSVTSSNAVISLANGTMYFRGGDDAEFWDINVANTVGIYGQQTQGVGAVKLGSGGPTLYGSGSNLGIGTTTPNSGTLHVNGGVFASSFTGSLLGTASYATQALTASNANTASYVITAQTASYVLQAVSSSFASTASFVNPLVQGVTITGSLMVSGGITTLDSLYLRRNPAYGGTTLVWYMNSSDNLQTDKRVTFNQPSYWSSGQGIQVINANVDFNGSTISNLYIANIVANASLKLVPDLNYALPENSQSLYIRPTSTLGSTKSLLKINDSTETSTYFRVGANGNIQIGTATDANYKLRVIGSSSLGDVYVTGSLNVTAGITGSLLGTASYASTASFVTTAQTASYVKTAQTASFYGGSVTSASYATTASYALSSAGGGAAFPYTGSAQITGSLGVTGSIYSNNTIGASYAGYFKNNSYNVGGNAPLIVDDGNAGGAFSIGYGGTSAFMYFPPYFGNNSIYLHGSGYYGVYFEGLSSYDGVTSFVAPGRVKIGNNTLPSSKLHVVGAGSTSATSTFIVENSSAAKTIECKDNQSIGFFGAATVTQPTTGIAGAAIANGAGIQITDDATFDGYTIAQVVAALRQLGLLA